MAGLLNSLQRLKKSVWGEEKNDANSSTLSRKDKRKLKKLEQSVERDEEVDEKEEEDDEEEEDEDEDESGYDLSRLQESDLEEDDDEEEDEDEDEEVEEEEDEEEEDEDEEDVPLSDVEYDEDADIIPHQKETVNNRPALKDSLSSIALPKNLKFVEHMSVVSDEVPILRDVYDDTERELAFYKQALAAANTAKKLCKAENIPFSRPADYFAEMVKSDEHMDRLKQKLIDDETAKKASQDARRQRELKKFGKQVQHAKLQEKQKEKRETMDKIKSLKRKRTNNDITSEDFDIAVEEAAEFSKPTKGAKRKAKDAKYGHGGQKRFRNKNDAESSADMSSFNSKKMKSSSAKPVKRPGRNRRHKR